MVKRVLLPILICIATFAAACSSSGGSAGPGAPAVAWPAVNVELSQRGADRIGYRIENRSDEAVKVDPLTVVEKESGTVVYQTSMQLSPGFVFSNSFPADPSKEHVATYQLHKGGETKVFTVEYRPAE